MNHQTSFTFGEMLRVFRKRSRLTQQQLAMLLGVHYNTIGGWERGEVLPDRKGIVLELGKQLRLDEQERRQFLEASLTALAPHWSVPLLRNPLFTGREQFLDSIHARLRGDQMGTITKSYAIYGLGGIGKTQLAVEYAYRYALEYTAVFWVVAESSETILASFSSIADLLQLPERQETDQQQLVAGLHRWLSRHDRWLLIWDNMETLEMLTCYLPSTRQGAMLITTRHQGLGGLVQDLELPIMTPEEGMLFLLRRARVLPPEATHEQMESWALSQPTEYTAAREAVTTLGRLPLALDQAGAYIEATHCLVSDYRHLLQLSPFRLLDEHDAPSGHPFSVIKTFTLIFQQVEQNYPLAAEMLSVCAFLAPEAIPEEVFLEGAAYLGGSAIEALAGDLFAFNAALKVLLRYLLIQRDATTRTISIHRLIQVALQGHLSPIAWQSWAGKVISTIAHLFPSDEKIQANYWQRCERLLPHALVCLTLSEHWTADEVVRVTLLRHVASYLSNRGRYAEAKLIFERATSLGLDYPKAKKTRRAVNPHLVERTVLCECGCGHEIDRSKSRGLPRRFFSRACKQRFYRNALHRKRNAASELR